jgi:hypothetical protein
MTTFKVQVAGVGENVWSGNGKTFESMTEANLYAVDLLGRWIGADVARVVTVDVQNGELLDLNDERIVVNYRQKP